jgi:DNA-binding YbaB/EbfC family protein
MANMIKMVSQAATMRKKMKRMQKEMAKHVVDVTSNNGKVTVSARGDMTIKDIKIDPSALEELKLDRLEAVLTKTVNSALKATQKAAGQEMAKSSGGGMEGLAEMLGGMK